MSNEAEDEKEKKSYKMYEDEHKFEDACR